MKSNLLLPSCVRHLQIAHLAAQDTPPTPFALNRTAVSLRGGKTKCRTKSV
jgi:hypothetical protein